MSTLLMNALTPEERARLREVEMKRDRDERERRVASQVDRIEREVRALKLLLGETEKPPNGEEHRDAR